MSFINRPHADLHHLKLNLSPFVICKSFFVSLVIFCSSSCGRINLEQRTGGPTGGRVRLMLTEIVQYVWKTTYRGTISSHPLRPAACRVILSLQSLMVCVKITDFLLFGPAEVSTAHAAQTSFVQKNVNSSGKTFYKDTRESKLV